VKKHRLAVSEVKGGPVNIRRVEDEGKTYWGVRDGDGPEVVVTGEAGELIRKIAEGVPYSDNDVVKAIFWGERLGGRLNKAGTTYIPCEDDRVGFQPCVKCGRRVRPVIRDGVCSGCVSTEDKS
jgi:hypothetical protein